MTTPGEPIEMELTASGAPRDDAVEFVVGVTEPDEPARLSNATVVIAAVFALVVGVVIGRVSAPDGSGEASTADDPPSATSAPEPDDGGVDSAPVDDTIAPFTSTDVDDEAGAAPTPSGQPTETVPDDSVVAATTIVELDERVAGIDLSLVGLGSDGLYELDLASGSLTVTTSGRLSAGVSDDARRLVSGPDWVVVTGVWEGGTFLLIEGEEPERFRQIDGLTHVPGTDRFWRTGSASLIEIDLAGDPTGVTLSTDGTTIVRGDPAGGLVVHRGGRLWSVSGDEATEMPPGELMALSAEVALTFGCDELADCWVRAVDRDTGVGRDVPVDDPFDLAPAPYFETLVMFPDASVAPSGEHAVVLGNAQAQPGLKLVDLTTGVVDLVPAGSDPWATSVVWSPDGRILFVASGSRLVGVDVTTGEAFPVLPESFDLWHRIVARPAAGG
jgi:hypothetical protein